MITLALLYWLASKIGGSVGEDWFYENFPIDPATGAITSYGVYAQTVQASRSQGDDYHTYVDLYAIAGDNSRDDSGNLIPTKMATDLLCDHIEDCVVGALDDPSSYVMSVPGAVPEQNFYDVRVTPYTGKNTMPELPSGAIVKSLRVEVWYKKG